MFKCPNCGSTAQMKLTFEPRLSSTDKNKLIEGYSIEKPTYDYANHTRSSVTETISPCDVIILEGLFVLQDEAIRNMLDMKIFIDTDADIRFIRRLKRDVKERARTLESVCQQYMTTVRVMHNAFVEPSKKRADIIIPEGGFNVVALEMLNQRIEGLLK